VAGLGADAVAGVGSIAVAGCANAIIGASTPIEHAKKFENMRKTNPLIVSIVLLRHACLAIGSSLAIFDVKAL
jgi:hypothetical protein